jgi:REP element-mobilizing transposase RayT
MPVHHRPPFGRKRLRENRTSEPGRIYLVTFVTAARRRVFDDWDLALAAARAMHGTYSSKSRVLCWVLMPDHWHGLLELGQGDSLSEAVRRLKGIAARAVNELRRYRGPLWVNGFHDHALRKDEDLVDMARYIVLNPVRAGIVARVGHYPFWDAVWLAEQEQEQEHRG